MFIHHRHHTSVLLHGFYWFWLIFICLYATLLPTYAIGAPSHTVSLDELTAFEGWQSDNEAALSALQKDLKIIPVTKAQFMAAKSSQTRTDTPLANKVNERFSLLCPNSTLTFIDLPPKSNDDTFTDFQHTATHGQINAFAITVSYHEYWAEWYVDKTTCLKVFEGYGPVQPISKNYLFGFQFDPFVAIDSPDKTGGSMEVMASEKGKILGSYLVNLPWVALPNAEGKHAEHQFLAKDGYYFTYMKSYGNDDSDNTNRGYARLTLTGNALGEYIKKEQLNLRKKRFYPIIFNYFDHPIQVRLGNEYIDLPACNAIKNKVNALPLYDPISIEDATDILWRFDTTYNLFDNLKTSAKFSDFDFEREENGKTYFYATPASITLDDTKDRVNDLFMTITIGQYFTEIDTVSDAITQSRREKWHNDIAERYEFSMCNPKTQSQ